MADPYRYFRIEAREILEQLQKDVLLLERERETQDSVPRLLRAAHTLKGAARIVRQLGIADAAHALEEVLHPLRQSPAGVTAEVVDQLFALLDEISRGVAALESGGGSPAAAPASGATSAPSPEPAVHTPEELSWYANASELDGLLEGLAAVGLQLGALGRLGSGLQAALGIGAQLRTQLTLDAHAKRDPHADYLRSTCEELLEALSNFGSAFTGHLDQATRELHAVREGTEGLRLVPAESMFGSLQRAARDAAHEQGKRVRFEAEGGGVKLETAVLQAVQRALVQAVRNAVAHGIESPQQRHARGKPVEGLVTIGISRRGKEVVFTCKDDGGGVDLAAVRKAAKERGVLAANTSGANEDGDSPDWMQLLTAGGVSTSGQVSQIAGRGIGLDMLHQTAKRFDGSLRADTRSGQGTTFELAIRASVSALDVLVVRCHEQTLCIPLRSVRGTLRVSRDELTWSAEHQTLRSGGHALRFLDLSAVLGVTRAAPDAWSVVVVEHDGQEIALGVDRLLGVETTVVRSLGALALVDPVILASSLDADGNPRLVLDPARLVNAPGSSTPTATTQPPSRLPVLVIDDSLTTRMLEQSVLQSAGYEVDLATSAEEGLVKAHQRRYALFLVDVEMPGMDGFSFVERTRQDPELSRTPAILVTSRNSPADLARGREVGAAGHIVKSEFDQNRFLEQVRLLTER